ncbi:MAG: hypothetical protein N2596_01230 [Syntrophorhabdaceae bacterium]|nr:hypothetical protein [Syntrophorhabdaceae bacterium]
MNTTKFLLFFCSVLCLFLISCASTGKKTEKCTEINRKYVDCFYDTESENLKCHISFDQSNFFTLPGKKLTMMADSGERLELWWTIDWLRRGYFFPRWRFALMYFNPDGTELQKEGVRIGECRFREGCNHGVYKGPDKNKNNIPDFITEIVWDNWDYGDDEGVAGYLDHYQHIYKPHENYYEVTHYLYFYPEKCIPPISPRREVCKISDECKPPYVIKEKRLIESKSF